MMKFNSVGLSLLVFLLFYWVVAILLIVFLFTLGIAIFFYLRVGNEFYFDFFKELKYSLRKAVPGGSILGIGIWIKAWLEERENKNQ